MAVVQCDRCGGKHSALVIREPDTNATVFPNDDSDCPACGSEDVTIIGDEDAWEDPT